MIGPKPVWEDGHEPPEAEWVFFAYDKKWRVLHRITDVKWRWSYVGLGEGGVSCGRVGTVEVPSDRYHHELIRCPVCCAAVGVPEGKGNPFGSGLKMG